MGTRQFEDDLKEIIVDAVLNGVAGRFHAFADLAEGGRRLTGLAILANLIDDHLVRVFRLAEHVEQDQNDAAEGGHRYTVENSNEKGLQVDRRLRLEVEKGAQERHVLERNDDQPLEHPIVLFQLEHDRPVEQTWYAKEEEDLKEEK